LVTFEINNLATSLRARGWDKVAPRLSKGKVASSAGRGKGMFNWLGKVLIREHNYKCCQRA